MALRSKKAVAILLSILVAISITCYLLRNDSNKSANFSNANLVTDNSAIEMPGMEIIAPENPGGKIRASSLGSSYVLPSYDKTFDETFEELKSASTAGKANAACLLAVELIRCQIMSKIDERLVDQMMIQSQPDNMTNADKLANDRFNLLQYRAYQACKKIPEDEIANSAGYLEKAAKLKQMDAMVLWASGVWIANWHGNNNTYSEDPAFLRWKDLAAPVMTEALKAGSYGAAREWLMAYNTNRNMPFYGLIKDDAKKAFTFSILVKRLENSGAAPVPRAGLSARDTLEAEQNARYMFEKWFGSKPTATGLSSGAFGPEINACAPSES